jgi:hypothetical protein
MPQSDINATWPDDADGDVLRKLESVGFDFSQSYAVDFNVDFHSWPPADQAVNLLESMFGAVEQCDPEDADESGYLLFKVHGPLSYEIVTSVQRRATSAMAPFGGICETWGILHQPRVVA